MEAFTAPYAQNHFGMLIDAACIVLLTVNKHDKPFVAEVAVEENEQLTSEIFSERTNLVSHKREK